MVGQNVLAAAPTEMEHCPAAQPLWRQSQELAQGVEGVKRKLGLPFKLQSLCLRTVPSSAIPFELRQNQHTKTTHNGPTLDLGRNFQAGQGSNGTSVDDLRVFNLQRRTANETTKESNSRYFWPSKGCQVVVFNISWMHTSKNRPMVGIANMTAMREQAVATHE